MLLLWKTDVINKDTLSTLRGPLGQGTAALLCLGSKRATLKMSMSCK